MFYEFSQNNSYGVFDVDDNLCAQLYIEADNAEQANEMAESLGCYWDGVDKGIDCPCCGDRWHKCDEDSFYTVNIQSLQEDGWSVSIHCDENEEHKWYEKYGMYNIVQNPTYEPPTIKYIRGRFVGTINFASIEEYAQFIANEYGRWTKPAARIFYKDGSVKEVFMEK